MPIANPITVLQNWAHARNIARDLFLHLMTNRGPGKGINLPANKTTSPVTARAVDLLLSAHPECVAQIWQDGLFLCFKDDLAVLQKSPSADFNSFHETVKTRPGEDLVLRTEVLMGQEPPKHVEQKPRWPGALDARPRDPRDVRDGEWAEWDHHLKEEAARKAAEERAARQDGVTPATPDVVNISLDLGSSPDEAVAAVESIAGTPEAK